MSTLPKHSSNRLSQEKNLSNLTQKIFRNHSSFTISKTAHAKQYVEQLVMSNDFRSQCRRVHPLCILAT